MSNLANALSTIESEFKNKDSIIMAKTNALDQTVKHLYDIRLHIESQLKRKVQDAQIVTEILAKLVPLTKDGPGT
jgi:hypothetical protein